MTEDPREEMDLQGQRISLGLTQAELGKRMGVSQATISLWENLRAQPDEVQLETLQQILQGSVASGPDQESHPHCTPTASSAP